MQKTTLSIIKFIALSIAAIITVVIMLRAADGKIDPGTLLFMLWGISPYLVFMVVTGLLEHFTRLPRLLVIACVISLLMLGFTLFAYVTTLNDTSSTGAIIFVFVPLWLYIGSFIFLTVGILVSWILKKTGPAE